ncbi:unnamed protein product [Sphacelaria rigidula]
MWLSSNTRPDIADAVRAASRHNENPTAEDWRKVFRDFEYLRAAVDLGITFIRGSSDELVAYVDADCAKFDDRRSESEGAIFFRGAVVGFFSRTQRNVTLSSTQAEYVAMGDVVKDALFVKVVLKFMQPQRKEFCVLVTVCEDNQGAIQLANNPRSSHNGKHIDIRHHFLTELVCEQVIRAEYVPTARQHADVLTKP